MRIFISWSGIRSRGYADKLNNLIQNILDPIDTFFSPSDITPGSRSNTEISKYLESSNFCILCLTKENFQAPWIMFEAGAISKVYEESSVCPLLFEGKISDLVGPLQQFQSSIFSKNEVSSLLVRINELMPAENQLTETTLNNRFEKFWPDLEKEVEDVSGTETDVNDAPARTERELLEEILTLARKISSEKSLEKSFSLNAESENFILNDIYFALKNKELHVSYDRDKNAMSVKLKSRDFIRNYDFYSFSHALYQLDTVELSPEEKELLSKVKFQLYLIGHELERVTGVPPSAK